MFVVETHKEDTLSLREIKCWGIKKIGRREGQQCYFLKEESHSFGITGALEGRSEQRSYSVRKVTLHLIKCNLVNVGKLVPSHVFLTPSTLKSSTPLPTWAPRAEALQGMETRGSTQSTVPPALSHAQPRAHFSHRRKSCAPQPAWGSPSPPSFSPGCSWPANHFPASHKQQIGMICRGGNSPFQQWERKKSHHVGRFYLFYFVLF